MLTKLKAFIAQAAPPRSKESSPESSDRSEDDQIEFEEEGYDTVIAQRGIVKRPGPQGASKETSSKKAKRTPKKTKKSSG